MDHFLHHGPGDPLALELLHDGHYGKFSAANVGSPRGRSRLVGGLTLTPGWRLPLKALTSAFGKQRLFVWVLPQSHLVSLRKTGPSAARWISLAVEEPL